MSYAPHRPSILQRPVREGGGRANEEMREVGGGAEPLALFPCVPLGRWAAAPGPRRRRNLRRAWQHTAAAGGVRQGAAARRGQGGAAGQHRGALRGSLLRHRSGEARGLVSRRATAGRLRAAPDLPLQAPACVLLCLQGARAGGAARACRGARCGVCCSSGTRGVLARAAAAGRSLPMLLRLLALRHLCARPESAEHIFEAVGCCRRASSRARMAILACVGPADADSEP